MPKPLRVTGTVIRTEGPEYVVSASSVVYQCVLGRKKLPGGRPVVGDRVEVTVKDGQRHSIVGRRRRTSVLERAAPGGRRGKRALVANIDLLVIVVAAAQPPPRSGLIDRYVVAAERQSMKPLICFNKWELRDEAELSELVDVYKNVGYPVIAASAATGFGIDDLVAAMTGHQSALVGHSGVGKSSLMRRIFPDLDFAVGEVNDVTGRGRHTTTHASLLPLPSGGFVIDTPGIREFGVVDVPSEELAGYFVEMVELADACRYRPCSHSHEPGCAVKAAVEDGDLSEMRYQSYLRLLDDLIERGQ